MKKNSTCRYNPYKGFSTCHIHDPFVVDKFIIGCDLSCPKNYSFVEINNFHNEKKMCLKDGKGFEEKNVPGCAGLFLKALF